MTAQKAFDEYHGSVYSFAYRLTGRADVAEDITQECFLVLVRSPHRYDANRGNVRTWLFAMARNLALKQYRDHHAEAPIADGAGFAGPGGEPVVASVVASYVEQAVSRLPQLQREALILFEYEGATLAEIAEVTGADVGTVKSRLHRARETLRGVLAPYRRTGSRT